MNNVDADVTSIINIADVDRETLYSDFKPLITRLINRYGDTREQREDLQGEIYCLFFRLLDEFDPKRGVPLRAYLVRQLSVSVYTYARKQWRRRDVEVSLEALTDANDEYQFINSGDDWDQEILQRVIMGDLPEAIEQLTHRQRQVIIWRYFESRTFEEIAVILGVAPATVRSLQRYGLHKLRRYFLNKYDGSL